MNPRIFFNGSCEESSLESYPESYGIFQILPILHTLSINHLLYSEKANTNIERYLKNNLNMYKKYI